MAGSIPIALSPFQNPDKSIQLFRHSSDKWTKPQLAYTHGHRHLRSAGRGYLDVPRVRLSTYGGHAFCYAGPSAWNALTDFLNKMFE